MNLENQISELLYHHDCVIVTDMGGFVANYRSAFVHPAHHTIFPPSKKIAFNASLTNNDGLLANHVATKLNMSYAEACNIIRDFKDDCFEVLNNGGQLSLDKIGILFLDSEKNIQFNADNSGNYLLESFGLGTVHSPVVKREGERKTIIKSLESKEKKSWWRLLEVIPAAAAIAFLLLNPQGINRVLNTSYNSFNPLDTFKERTASSVNSQPVNKITPVETSVAKETSGSPAANISQPEKINTEPVKEITTENNINTNTVIPAETSAITETPAVSNEKSEINFYIVAGCFKIESNAENFKNDLIAKGFHADIVGTYKGLQVVSCASASTQSEAQTTLEKIKQSLEAGAWIMKK